MKASEMKLIIEDIIAMHGKEVEITGNHGFDVEFFMNWETVPYQNHVRLSSIRIYCPKDND